MVWNKGLKGVQKHSEETKKKISDALKGITFEQKYGMDKARILKQQISQRMSGSNSPRFGIAPWNKGLKKSAIVKCKKIFGGSHMKNLLTSKEKEFLIQSNLIERESGDIKSIAMVDAIKAWVIAKESNNPFTIKGLLEIHNMLLGRITPHYAGFIRDGAVSIGGNIRDQSKDEIIGELNTLFESWKKYSKFLKNVKIDKQEEFIKKWHIAYERTHPFFDGNGRTGRILMNLQRIALDLPILIIHEGKEQMEYYKWFKEVSHDLKESKGGKNDIKKS